MTERKPVYKAMDGNTAAAYASYYFTEVAAIYPITPSSTMAEKIDVWSVKNRKNLFGEKVEVIEMQSEGGASGVVHGSLQAGALTSTYTASQGLMLMIPNMFKIAGERLPAVFHVASRVVASNGLSIHCDYSDVMATRTTGFALLSSGSVQEAMDFSAISHLSAIKCRIPFLHFFDGFRTSHEIQKIDVLQSDDLKDLIDYKELNEFRRNALNPDHPTLGGTVQLSDIHFQQREIQNKYWENVPNVVEFYMDEIYKKTGRRYKPFTYYGSSNADRIIVAMGSMCQTIEETVDYLNRNDENVGLLKVHLFRPFSLKHFLCSIPDSVKQLTVLDRVKEIGSQAEPLYMDVKTAFYNIEDRPKIIGGRCGIGGKEVSPSMIYSVFENMKNGDKAKDNFTLGIIDDVNGTSLDLNVEIDTIGNKLYQTKFWGMGSDGTVGANKSAIKIIGEKAGKYCQGYFAYDSKKSGGVTISHLRFGNEPIKSTYLVQKPDFVACSQQSYVNKYDILSGLKKGGTFLLNTQWNQRELEKNIPNKLKKYISVNNILFYTIDAVDIAKEIGLGNRTNMIMQSAFFKLNGILNEEAAKEYLKIGINNDYGHKGKSVLDKNYRAVDLGMSSIKKIEIPEEWSQLDNDEIIEDETLPSYVKDFLLPVNKMEGDKIPVSVMESLENGMYPSGTTKYEKRGAAVDVPKWDSNKCIECNQCSLVCPHAAIRPFLLDEEESDKAPENLQLINEKTGKEYNYTIGISLYDCTGCGLCAHTCPAKEKALSMVSFQSAKDDQNIWNYLIELPVKRNPINKYSVKGSQFEQPLLEFSGACAGCVETAYAKLLTQLYGDRMMIANSAGCSHVWTASIPANPYTTNDCGHGPAWNSSLFEDTAEFGLGMLKGTKQVQRNLLSKAKLALRQNLSSDTLLSIENWIEKFDSSENTRERANKLIKDLENETNKTEEIQYLLKNRDYLVKRSQWIIGGDGWAYDIGYGGLDHVLASGENVNVLVLDTEVYSNTGGQASKSTPIGATAKFAASGKKSKKKDLGLMMMSYSSIYVAQVAIGANQSQTLKAIKEAEEFDGPSIIIAYCPCINHGLKKGMSYSHERQKDAVNCGYWTLYRYNPDLIELGKNPFILDSKEPTEDFQEFLMGEVRYFALKQDFPEESKVLLKQTEITALNRYKTYKKLSQQS